jgi:hypothetical protein
MGARRQVRYALAALAASALSLSCRPGPKDAPGVRRAACPDAAVDTAGWQVAAYGPFTTILPAAFRLDTVTMRCFHGGVFRVAGARTFGYCRGTMEPIAPTGRRGERVLSVAGRQAVVACVWYAGRWTVSAHHLGDSTQFGIHGESPDLAGLAIFVRALESARPPGP